jgi:hypothetical protein
MVAIFKHVGRTVTEEAKLSVDCFVVVQNLFVFHQIESLLH